VAGFRWRSEQRSGPLTPLTQGPVAGDRFGTPADDLHFAEGDRDIGRRRAISV
jgi:hypothetical protein